MEGAQASFFFTFLRAWKAEALEGAAAWISTVELQPTKYFIISLHGIISFGSGIPANTTIAKNQDLFDQTKQSFPAGTILPAKPD
jgi:hypothetical protein